MFTQTRLALGIAVFAAFALFATSGASAAGVYGSDCNSATSFTYDQCTKNANDDSDNYAGKYNSDCYGACGPGCNLNCGSGGACLTHDYDTRTYGMFSSTALKSFPAAAAQWGRCVMSAGASSASGTMKSAWSGIKRTASSVVSKIFN
jgi:hypothetical protein